MRYDYEDYIEALSSKNPTENLRRMVNANLEAGVEDWLIMCHLDSIRLKAINPANQAILLDAISALSPHFQKHQGVPDSNIQKLIDEAHNRKVTNPDALINLVRNLRAQGLDKGGILFELEVYRRGPNIRYEEDDDDIMGVMDMLWGWCRPELRID